MSKKDKEKELARQRHEENQIEKKKQRMTKREKRKL